MTSMEQVRQGFEDSMKNKSSIILADEDIYNITHTKNSLTTMVYENLVSMFLTHQLVPGQILNRRTLAVEFGVSVAPVLEALVQLEREGFVESVHRRGTIVSPVRENDVYERLVLREALECCAVRLYCGDTIAKHMEELKAYATVMDAQPHTDFTHLKWEITLHASLVNLAGLPLLTREFVRIFRVGVFCNINRMISTSWTQQQKHVQLLDKLMTANPDEAEIAMRDHLWSGKPVFNRLKNKI